MLLLQSEPLTSAVAWVRATRFSSRPAVLPLPASRFASTLVQTAFIHFKTILSTMAVNNAILAIIGFILSAYSVYVEHKVDQKFNPDEEFRALCDIEAIGASCR